MLVMAASVSIGGRGRQKKPNILDLPLRRRRLGRIRLPRQQGHPHAEHRFDRQERRAVHARLRGRHVLQPVAGRPDDGPISNALRPRVQQRRRSRAACRSRKRRWPIAFTRSATRRAPSASGTWATSPNIRPMKRGFDEFFGTLANTPYYHPAQFVDSRVSPDVQQGRRPGLLHDRCVRRAGRRLARQAEQGQALVPVRAVQRAARAAASAGEVSRPIQEHHRREAAHVRGHDVGDGRCRRQDPRTRFATWARRTTRWSSSSPTTAARRSRPLRTTCRCAASRSTTWEGGTRIPFCVPVERKAAGRQDVREPDYPARHPADRTGRRGR